MNTVQQGVWHKAAVKWAAWGAAVGALIGLVFSLPVIFPGAMPAAWRQGLLLAAVKLTGSALVIGAGIGAAAGSFYAGFGRRWFWTATAALGVGLVVVTLMTRDIRTSGTVFMVAGGVLAVAFGLWVLLAAALHTWRTQQE